MCCSADAGVEVFPKNRISECLVGRKMSSAGLLDLENIHILMRNTKCEQTKIKSE